MTLDFDVLAVDEVEIVEQPFRRGCGRFPAVDVGRERVVGVAQDSHILAEAAEESAGSRIGMPGERQSGRQFAGFGFQSFEAEELSAERTRGGESRVVRCQFLKSAQAHGWSFPFDMQGRNRRQSRACCCVLR